MSAEGIIRDESGSHSKQELLLRPSPGVRLSCYTCPLPPGEGQGEEPNLRTLHADSWRSGPEGGRLEVVIVPFDEVDVYCSSLPTKQGPLERTTRDRGKLILASRLWRAFVSARSQSGLHHPASASQIEIVSDGTGRPRLLVGKSEGRCISFSHGESATWAALCDGPSCCGIDVAGASEFEGGYPFHRAFHDEELRRAAFRIARNRQEAAALLWSAKEAVVKALGCGFHLIDPLGVEIGGLQPAANGICSVARVSGRGLTNGQALILVHSFRTRGAWISVSVAGEEHAF